MTTNLTAAEQGLQTLVTYLLGGAGNSTRIAQSMANACDIGQASHKAHKLCVSRYQHGWILIWRELGMHSSSIFSIIFLMTYIVIFATVPLSIVVIKGITKFSLN